MHGGDNTAPVVVAVYWTHTHTALGGGGLVMPSCDRDLHCAHSMTPTPSCAPHHADASTYAPTPSLFPHPDPTLYSRHSGMFDE